jgi:hypothetical protein
MKPPLDWAYELDTITTQFFLQNIYNRAVKLRREQDTVCQASKTFIYDDAP